MEEIPEVVEEERTVYRFFLWSILLKGAISVAEIAAGIAVFFIPPAVIVSIATFFLTYIPAAALQSTLMDEVAKYTTGAVTFVALYLLVRGAIKAGLIFALLKSKLWAYPASLLVLGLFVIYQAYQIFTDRSLIVGAITIFDLFVMYFIYREWNIVKRHHAT